MKSWQKILLIAFIANEVLLLSTLLWMLISDEMPSWGMACIRLLVVLSLILGGASLFVKGRQS
jgi:hypothetical protein